MHRTPNLLVVATAALVSACFALPQGASAQPTTWNFTQAQIPAAQPLGNYGRGATVAVVDTWVDQSDTEFGGRVTDEAYCVGGNGSCKDHEYAPDQCTHGTHVTGTVGSADYGVAPEVHILAVQVLSYDSSNQTCGGSGQDVAAGIGFAVAHGAQVINLSIGDLVPLLLQDSNITQAVAQAAAAGVVVVVAAGNSSLPLTDSYGNDAVLVAATGPSGQLASYSNSGGSVNIAAPGGDTGSQPQCDTSDCVLSTLPANHTGLMEGTSMAAPHVAGTAALLLSQFPGRGRANVISTLESTAQPLAGAGSGLLDAVAALKVDAAAHPPQTSPAAASPAASHTPPAPGSSTSGAVGTHAQTSPASSSRAVATIHGGTVPSTSTTHPASGTTGASNPASSPPTTTGKPVALGASTPGHQSWASRNAAPITGAILLLAIAAAGLALEFRTRMR